jgi:hypothetical protein
MLEIHLSITLLFGITIIATLYGFYKASLSKKALTGILIWMTLVGIIGYSGFYNVQNKIPPRFIFLVGPGILFVIFYFLSKKGEKASRTYQIKWLTLLHTIRIPVEIVLYYVFLAGYIPNLMTFEGYNFDILSGLSAPLMYYAVFVKKWIGKKGLLIWNFSCLGLLLNILTIAVLSASTPIQLLAFEQPNVGVAYFPFVWLPAVIVPVVLYSHLVSIRLLLKSRNSMMEV